MAWAAETPQALAKRIEEMEQQMYRHARDLEFEEAARLRDEIRRMQSAALELPPGRASAAIKGRK